MKLKEIKPNMAIHCNTEKEAKEVIKWAYECGFRWEFSSNKEIHWNFSKDFIIYYFHEDKLIGYSTIEDYAAIEFSDLIISDEELTAVEAIKLKNEMCNDCYNSSECIFKQKYSEKISISCNEWTREHPEEVIESLKQYKKTHSSIQPKEPEIEWVWRVFTTGSPTEYKSSEEEAEIRCEEIAKIDGKNAWYSSMCRVKEN